MRPESYTLPHRHAQLAAFSLVELSIVLVILGLLVGGVLSGKSLIEAAKIRSQLGQITQFSIATKTFKDKYFYFPGDLPEPIASQAGFQPRGAYSGEGDGNGILAGNRSHNATPSNTQLMMQCGENLLFWTDLSKAGLIPGGFTTATFWGSGTYADATSSPGYKDYFPESKFSNAYILVAGSSAASGMPLGLKENKSYFSLQRIANNMNSCALSAGANTVLTVAQAYQIDMKIDDGKPLSGTVLAMSVMAGYQIAATSSYDTSYGYAQAGTATTCFDNNNSASNTATYTTAFDGGSGQNCTLMFEGIN